MPTTHHLKHFVVRLKCEGKGALEMGWCHLWDQPFLVRPFEAFFNVGIPFYVFAHHVIRSGFTVPKLQAQSLVRVQFPQKIVELDNLLKVSSLA